MEVYIVDAFTNKPFAGNPAAVCVLKQFPDPTLMQKIASEMNLSETAFVCLVDTNEDIKTASSFLLKWFTPLCEVNLCGHATLATASVIFNSYHNTNARLSFTTLSGELKAIKSGSDDITSTSVGSGISLELPLADSEPQDISLIDPLINTVIGNLPVSDCRYSNKTKKLLIRLSDTVTQSQLELLRPNTNNMMSSHTGKIKGVIVTLKSEGGAYDFLSRYFAPWVGIPEDPVTGSAHTVLGPYWSKILNKTVLRARQCSPRGGDMVVTVEENIVNILGESCIVMKGILHC